MKLGKELTLTTEKPFNVRIGTVNNKEPRTLYLVLSSWVEPTEDLDDYQPNLNKIKKNIKRFLNTTVPSESFNKEKIILDFDLRSSGIVKNKKSFMSCEITLFQKDVRKINTPSVIMELQWLSTKLIKEVFEIDKNFTYNSKKKL
jgi:hypothetical protein|tara:strand:+ start:333 stop:767 length:435 start_codon:yes stop_codon:yes gene_type:complete